MSILHLTECGDGVGGRGHVRATAVQSVAKMKELRIDGLSGYESDPHDEDYDTDNPSSDLSDDDFIVPIRDPETGMWDRTYLNEMIAHRNKCNLIIKKENNRIHNSIKALKIRAGVFVPTLKAKANATAIVKAGHNANAAAKAKPEPKAKPAANIKVEKVKVEKVEKVNVAAPKTTIKKEQTK